MPDSSSTPSAARLPRRLGPYALFDFIGKGGMAEIYLARVKTDLGAARLSVVKEILPELAEQPKFAEMLIHEAKLAARLSHANVVQVFDLGRADKNRLFIAMEYVEGFDLNDLLRRCSRNKVPLPFEFALRIVHDALSGLGYAHRRIGDDGRPLGIVHRDVSPSNILISFEGEVKLCDFGIAHAIGVADDSKDASGGAWSDAIKGKAGYMSPEQARGERLDARADIFAIGIVLWELIAGRRMYKADTGRPPLLEQARQGEIPELAMRGLPDEAELHRILFKALAKKPDDRYPTAQSMQRDLETYMAKAKLLASQLRLGEWMSENFAGDMLEQRRARERAVMALEKGAPVSYGTLPPAPTPLPSMIPPSNAPPSSVPNIANSPPPTPLPSNPRSPASPAHPATNLSAPKIPKLPPPPAFHPIGAAAIDPPSSIAAVDRSPPSSLSGNAAPATAARSSRATIIAALLMIVIALGVAAAMLVAHKK